MKNIFLVLIPTITACSTSNYSKNPPPAPPSAPTNITINKINRVPPPKPLSPTTIKWFRAPEERLKTDIAFRIAVRKLMTDFLDDQMRGEPTPITRVKYGADNCKIDSFNDVIAYQLIDFDERNGINPFFRAKETGRGQLLWRDYQIMLKHYPELEKIGDRYLGLRIVSVTH